MFSDNPKKEIKKLRKEIELLRKSFEYLSHASSLMQKLSYDYDNFNNGTTEILESQKVRSNYFEELKGNIEEICHQLKNSDNKEDEELNLRTLNSIYAVEIMNEKELNESFYKVDAIVKQTLEDFGKFKELTNSIQEKLETLDKQLDGLNNN